MSKPPRSNQHIQSEYISLKNHLKCVNVNLLLKSLFIILLFKLKRSFSRLKKRLLPHKEFLHVPVNTKAI